MYAILPYTQSFFFLSLTTSLRPVSPLLVGISANMRARTVFRLRNLHLYGREVFTEATIDPLKTVNKDVLPRFLVSGFYQDLDRRLKSIITLPAASDFSVKPPRSSAALKLNMNHDTLGRFFFPFPTCYSIPSCPLYTNHHEKSHL